MNFLLRFLNRKWHKQIKTWIFALFVPNEKTSLFFSTEVQVLHLLTVHHSVFVIYCISQHAPGCPHTHKDTLFLHQWRWRDEEMKRKWKCLFDHTVSLFPRKQVSQSLKIQHQWEKGHFWLVHFCFALNIHFYLTTCFRKRKKRLDSSPWLNPAPCGRSGQGHKDPCSCCMTFSTNKKVLQ